MFKLNNINFQILFYLYLISNHKDNIIIIFFAITYNILIFIKYKLLKIR
jgi:hypothetical protein